MFHDSKKLMTLFLVLSCTSHAYGEPAGDTKYLIGEPVSLFEWGIDKLENSLQERFTGYLKKEIVSLKVNVAYNFEEDRLRIIFHGETNPDITVEERRVTCKMLVGSVRYNLGIDPRTGNMDPIHKEMGSLHSELGASYFAHDGYASGNRPKNFGADLDTKTVISVMLGVVLTEGSGVHENLSKSVFCEGKLLSNDVMFRERVAN